METIVAPSRAGTVVANSERNRLLGLFGLFARMRRSRGVPDAYLLPTYEATDEELRLLAEPAFEQRIDRVHYEAAMRLIMGHN